MKKVDTKNSNVCDFIVQIANMNYVNTNRVDNFLYMYNIPNNEENLKKLKQVIEE